MGTDSNNRIPSFSKSLLEKDFSSNNNQNTKDNFYSENTSLLLYILSMAFYGMNNFHLKYIQFLFKENYDIFSFGIWRMITFTLVIKAIINYKKVEIVPLNKMKKNTLIWLGVRSFGQFLSLLFFMRSLEDLRVGTANCFVSMNPAAILIISSILLKEKFHWRYPLGIGICFIGVLIIISNEINNSQIEIGNNNTTNIFLGIFWGSLNLVMVALLSVSSKLLNEVNIGQENQCYYIGVSNVLCFAISIIFKGKLKFSPLFILISASNSIILLTATFLIITALQGVDLNKTTALNYFVIVVSTFLSIVFLGEPLYFTDVLGSLIILGYNIYNSLNPIKD